jgi:hypothetical protein
LLPVWKTGIKSSSSIPASINFSFDLSFWQTAKIHISLNSTSLMGPKMTENKRGKNAKG